MFEGDILKGGEQELLTFRTLLQDAEQTEKDIKDAELREKEKQKQIEMKNRIFCNLQYFVISRFAFMWIYLHLLSRTSQVVLVVKNQPANAG